MICSVFLPKLSQPPLRFSPGAPSPTTASQLRFLPASAQGLCALPAVLQWASCAYLDPTLNLDLDFDLDFPNVPPPSRSLNLCLLQSQSSGPFPYIPIRLFFPSRHQPTMPPRDPPPHMRVLLEAIQQEYGTTNVFEAMTRQQSLAPKWVRGHKLLRDDPSQWFRGTQIDDRDLALINAGPVPWINIGQQSYLKHVHHKIKDQPFETTHWTVENDKALRDMISEVGAGFTGWAKPLVLPTRDWESMLVNVTVTGNIAPGVTWGLLSGRPSKARVLAGPCSTCPEHPWDIMILRDFHTNTSGLDQVSSIASRQFDILLMKMCEDMDYPWVVLAVKDSGPWNPQPCSSNGHCDNSCLGF
ncbi:hypothetical protein FJTKL_08689 [Diaporthe vaccinii]|uniref:Uncharacterized protein n=1 Tax=Diaporthe vaccinii TaxID=105482 RepID=A0ABR4ER00_9PEZI